MISRRIIAGSNSRILYCCCLFILLLVKPTVPASGETWRVTRFQGSWKGIFFLFKCFRNRSPSSHLHSIWRPEARLFCGGSPWIPRIWSPGRLRSPDPSLAPLAALHVWELRHRGLVQAKRRSGRVSVLRGDPLRQPDKPRAQHHRRPRSRNAGRAQWTHYPGWPDCLNVMSLCSGGVSFSDQLEHGEEGAPGEVYHPQPGHHLEQAGADGQGSQCQALYQLRTRRNSFCQSTSGG